MRDFYSDFVNPTHEFNVRGPAAPGGGGGTQSENCWGWKLDPKRSRGKWCFGAKKIEFCEDLYPKDRFCVGGWEKTPQKDRVWYPEGKKRGSKPRHICIAHHIGSTPPPPHPTPGLRSYWTLHVKLLILFPLRVLLWWTNFNWKCWMVRVLQGQAGFILCMCPANERQPYIVTSSLVGCAHTQNDPCKGVKETCFRDKPHGFRWSAGKRNLPAQSFQKRGLFIDTDPGCLRQE